MGVRRQVAVRVVQDVDPAVGEFEVRLLLWVEEIPVSGGKTYELPGSRIPHESFERHGEVFS